MKQLLLIFTVWLPTVALFAQNQPTPGLIEPDTIFSENFENFPEDDLLETPTGADNFWVSFDADMRIGLCVDGDPTPNGWYIEADLGQTTVENYAFSSCSFFSNDFTVSAKNENWLILPAISIPDSTCELSWKSLTYQGPGFLDGYKVIVSTNSNLPFSGDFADTLFYAAEMLSSPGGLYGSHNLNDFIFSPGYIHADGFSNPEYFEEAFNVYYGKLEPHTVSLKQYAGKQVFIAFLHDSDNDFLIQVDDIAVLDHKTSATRSLAAGLLNFSIQPTVVTDQAKVSWAFAPGIHAKTICIYDVTGHLLSAQPIVSDTYQLNTESYTKGVYFITLQADHGGIATRRFVKI